MTNLKAKLIKLLRGNTQANEPYANTALDIEKLFEEAGYLPAMSRRSLVEILKDDTAYKLMQAGYMTGVEWYKRFEDALLLAKPDDPKLVNEALMAAKRASGVKK